MKKWYSLLLIIIIGCSTNDKTKPNILFIMSDDHAYQAISAYDNRLINTPNIDRIANQGILFTNACVTNSICAPSRAVILTGKHSHLNGKIDNHAKFDDSQITFPQLFQKAGYQTAMFGKLHFGNNPKGVDDFFILPGQGSYINPKFLGKDKDTIITGYVTDVITDLTLDWFKTKRDKKKPFLMMYLHKAPHRAWWPSPDKFAEFYEKEFPEPETLFDDYLGRGTAAKKAEMNILTHMQYMHDSKVKPSAFEQMDKVEPEIVYIKSDGTFMRPNAQGFNRSFDRANKEQKEKYNVTLDKISDDFKTNWPKMNDKEKMRWKYQRYMQDYLATISSVDENIGRVLNYLEETGLDKNTIVVYTSDQGFYLGEHGWFDKRFIYNESFKTPLMIKWPNVIKPGTTSDEMVQNLDFAQTFLEAAMIKAPDDMQGKSLIPLLKGDFNKWDRDAVYYHYYEYPSVHMAKRHYGIVTKKFKLVHFYYDIDEWELYDRLKDPNEMNNVYNDSQYKDVVKKLTQELKEIRIKYKDSEELDKSFIY
ncbi:MAG: sulfatase [Flavobacteriaceae bacterium]|nr:sulfatase [Flavobacteriaceae bacterium]|tara:strand:+ start:1995 stop:3596 length:1602 start_codon:yes stop_codon:yes gene_type:complete